MTRRERDRELDRLRAWIEARRPAPAPSTWAQWVGDALAMLFVAIAGFVIVWGMFAL